MTTKEQLIKLVIGNSFIQSPRLQELYKELLDRLEAETKQCDIPVVIVPFFCNNDDESVRCKEQCLGCDGFERNE